MAERLPTFALSVRQPWAWAIIHGGKDIENRTAASVRHMPRAIGRIAIHAAKGMTRDEYEDARTFMLRCIGIECPRPDEVVRGAVIGAVTVTAVVSESESKWFFGPRGLGLSDPQACDPIPAVGALGIFSWRQAGDIDPAKPWMRAWPDGAPKSRKQGPPPMPLLDG